MTKKNGMNLRLAGSNGEMITISVVEEGVGLSITPLMITLSGKSPSS